MHKIQSNIFGIYHIQYIRLLSILSEMIERIAAVINDELNNINHKFTDRNCNNGN